MECSEREPPASPGGAGSDTGAWEQVHRAESRPESGTDPFRAAHLDKVLPPIVLFLFFQSNRLGHRRNSNYYVPSDREDGPFRARSLSCSCEHFGMGAANVRCNVCCKGL